jgi:NAD(P)-dependent dehydrogenase (short-subunit alcohol dehydrogenase family)
MWTKADIPDQSGKIILITGANTGIGYETALGFYEAGAYVILACRDNEKAKEAIVKLHATGGRGELEAISLDLSDLGQVKHFADEVTKKFTALHVLINNAGVATPPPSKTAQGFELQFGVNFLGHFALTGYLYPLLKSTSGARVVTISSMGYQSGSIDFNNLRSEKDYDRMREYRQSKLADMIFAIELDRRIATQGDEILSIAAQPGANKTELTRHLTEEEVTAGIKQLGGFMEAWQGALPSLYASISTDVRGGNLYQPDIGGYRGYPALAAIQDNALDKNVAGKLWALAEEITGVIFPLKNTRELNGIDQIQP